MSYWIGTQEAIIAAEALAAAQVVGRPEYRDGVELPPEDWVTERWAIPLETAVSGVWAIPTYPGLDLPDGCTTVESVEWPAYEEV